MVNDRTWCPVKKDSTLPLLFPAKIRIIRLKRYKKKKNVMNARHIFLFFIIFSVFYYPDKIVYTSVQWIRIPLRSMPRNHVIWRFANWWMAVASCVRISS